MGRACGPCWRPSRTRPLRWGRWLTPCWPWRSESRPRLLVLSAIGCEACRRRPSGQPCTGYFCLKKKTTTLFRGWHSSWRPYGLSGKAIHRPNGARNPGTSLPNPTQRSILTLRSFLSKSPPRISFLGPMSSFFLFFCFSFFNEQGDRWKLYPLGAEKVPQFTRFLFIFFTSSIFKRANRDSVLFVKCCRKERVFKGGFFFFLIWLQDIFWHANDGSNSN